MRPMKKLQHREMAGKSLCLHVLVDRKWSYSITQRHTVSPHTYRQPGIEVSRLGPVSSCTFCSQMSESVRGLGDGSVMVKVLHECSAVEFPAVSIDASQT